MAINMNIGGTEKALLNMISEIPMQEYEVTLLMLEKYGGFLEEIPSWVRVKYLDNYSEIKPILNNPPLTTIKEFIKKRKIIKALGIAFNYYYSKFARDKGIFFKYVLKKYPIIDEDYDLAVAYAGPLDFITYYVINKVKANQRAQWIHFDIEKIGFDKQFAKKYYDNFNNIFVVSNEARDKFKKNIPELDCKIEVFYNIISYKNIIELSREKNGYEDNFDGIRIATVGRLSKEKGQDLTIPVLARLKHDGFKIRWYCIGDGQCRQEYEALINSYNLKGEYILLGNKKNPYPYMKNCDIYVQPSRYEGYCTTVEECKCFSNPIIMTNVNSAIEQINNGVTGIICEIDENEIYKAIYRILSDKTMFLNIKKNLDDKKVKRSNDISKLLYLLE